MQFPRLLRNRGNGMQRVSSDAGSWREAPERFFFPSAPRQNRRGEHRSSAITHHVNRRTANGRPYGCNLSASVKKQDFHLIRPVCALGTFPSRGRLEKAFSFLAVWFFDKVKKASPKACLFKDMRV